MKLITIVLPFIGLLFSSSPALAVLPNPTNAAIRQEIRQERRSFWSETRKKRAEIIYNRLRGRLTARYQFLTNSKAKVESRIASKEQSNRDMTAAKAKLAEFAAPQAAYQTDLATFDAKFQEILASEQPLAKLGELNQAAKKVRDDLNSMRKILVDTIKLIIKA